MAIAAKNITNKCLVIGHEDFLEAFPVGDEELNRAFANRIVEIKGRPLSNADKGTLRKILEQSDFSMFTGDGLSAIHVNGINVYRGSLGKPQPKK